MIVIHISTIYISKVANYSYSIITTIFLFETKYHCNILVLLILDRLRDGSMNQVFRTKHKYALSQA